MLLTTIDRIPDTQFDVLGLVEGSIVCMLEPAKQLMVDFRTLVGGEMVEYSKLLTQSRQTAVERMMASAELLGADAQLTKPEIGMLVDAIDRLIAEAGI